MVRASIAALLYPTWVVLAHHSGNFHTGPENCTLYASISVHLLVGKLPNGYNIHPQAMKQKVETLQADLSRRQESYIRRERAFNMRIEELEEEVGSLKVR